MFSQKLLAGFLMQDLYWSTCESVGQSRHSSCDKTVPKDTANGRRVFISSKKTILRDRV